MARSRFSLALSTTHTVMTAKVEILKLFQQFCKLADVPINPVEFSLAAQRLGWLVKENEYAPENEVCLEVKTPFSSHPLIAVFSEHSIAGLPLFILVEDEDEDDDDALYVTTREEFDDAFHKVKAEIEKASTGAKISGTYESGLTSGMFHYAVWPRSAWHVVLLQHFEGDANYGHGPTLDLRLLPRSSDANGPLFPLDTNLIF